MRSAVTPLVVPMQSFPIKTISLRECRRCKSLWSSEREKLEPGDQIHIAMVKIPYCASCADDFAAETDQPTYKRGPGSKSKRIR